MALTKVYKKAGSLQVRIDKGEADETFCPSSQLRIEPDGTFLNLRDAITDVLLARILFTEVANSAGTAIGTKAQVLDALELFIG